MTFVIDTNVPLVANNAASHAEPSCVIACVKLLRDLMQDDHRLALDEQWLIIGEYQRKLRSTGQPGLGDAFLKWVLTNRCNSNRCVLVHVTPGAAGDSFVEFPDDPDLRTFDPSDRKFVAVAISCERLTGAIPQIQVAVDPGWWNFREALNRNGVDVHFLCPDDIRRLAGH